LRRIYNEKYDGQLVRSAYGKYINIDGKWLLDTCMGCGTHIFGHPKFTFNWGSTLYGHPNALAEECGFLLHIATGFDNFIFANSGTEATMKAIRLARAVTGRDKIAFMENQWHGSHDYNLVSYSSGIPQHIKDSVIILPFTDKAFEIIKDEKPALVMVEPVQGSSPEYHYSFLSKLREVTKDNGVLLCFDEVISGFRMALGGMASVLGIKPDLVTYGKTIGGGVPIGIIAGNDIIKEVKNNVFMGGTFSANPVMIKSCIKTLKRLIKEKPYLKLYDTTECLYNEHIKVCGAMAKVVTKLDITDELFKRGIYLNKNRLMLFSTLHTQKDALYINNCIKDILDKHPQIAL